MVSCGASLVACKYGFSIQETSEAEASLWPWIYRRVKPTLWRCGLKPLSTEAGRSDESHTSSECLPVACLPSYRPCGA